MIIEDQRRASLNRHAADFVASRLRALLVRRFERRGIHDLLDGDDLAFHVPGWPSRNGARQRRSATAFLRHPEKIGVKTIRFDRRVGLDATRHSRARQKFVRARVIPIESPAMRFLRSAQHFQRSIVATIADLFAGEKTRLVPHSQASGFDATGNDAAFVEAVNILNAKTQRQIGLALSAASKSSNAFEKTSVRAYHFILQSCASRRFLPASPMLE